MAGRRSSRTSRGPFSWCRTRDGVTPRSGRRLQQLGRRRQWSGPRGRRGHEHRRHRLVVPGNVRLHQRPSRIRAAVPGRGPARPAESAGRWPHSPARDRKCGCRSGWRSPSSTIAPRSPAGTVVEEALTSKALGATPAGVVLHAAWLREEPGLVSGRVRAGRRELRRTHAHAGDSGSADRREGDRAAGGGVRGTRRTAGGVPRAIHGGGPSWPPSWCRSWTSASAPSPLRRSACCWAVRFQPTAPSISRLSIRRCSDCARRSPRRPRRPRSSRTRPRGATPSAR